MAKVKLFVLGLSKDSLGQLPMCSKALALLAIALACTVSSSAAQTPACYYIRVPTQAANLGYSAGFKSIGGCAPSTVK